MSVNATLDLKYQKRYINNFKKLILIIFDITLFSLMNNKSHQGDFI